MPDALREPSRARQRAGAPLRDTFEAIAHKVLGGVDVAPAQLAYLYVLGGNRVDIRTGDTVQGVLNRLATRFRQRRARVQKEP